jgi:hypothetical protein
MIFEKQTDLIERKKPLGWTNREIGNAIGCSPSVASSKLNGFIVLTPEERRKLEKAFAIAERTAGELAQ